MYKYLKNLIKFILSKKNFFFQMIKRELKLFLIGLFFSCINGATIQQAKSNPLQGYVLTSQDGKVIEDSGIRIGPLDLKFESIKSLNEYKLPQELVQKLQPYLGLSGQQASSLVQQKPLILSPQEFDILKKSVTTFWAPKVLSLPPQIKNSPTVI